MKILHDMIADLQMDLELAQEKSERADRLEHVKKALYYDGVCRGLKDAIFTINQYILEQQK